MLRILFVVASLVLWYSPISHASPDEPSSFDECIIDAMRGVSSDVAARAIIDSCRNLFPESESKPAPAAVAPTPAPEPQPAPQPQSAPQPQPAPTAKAAAPPNPVPLDTTGARRLTDDELARLRTRAKVFGARYRVTIDNDNPNLTLTEVTIAVWDDTDLGATRKEYAAATQIAPQTSAEVKFTVHYDGDSTGWNWGVVAARGVE